MEPFGSSHTGRHAQACNMILRHSSTRMLLLSLALVLFSKSSRHRQLQGERLDRGVWVLWLVLSEGRAHKVELYCDPCFRTSDKLLLAS